ncbi:MAG: hypothetical protein D8M59_16960 [Planctomycetes bacterium]|nr:hypothetical protein [Planctomycetota bacterium]NOG52879.1 hypothetical protein [Planctomycetota bacterium]
MGRRAVITGLGTATGLGIGCESFWEALVEGRSAIGRIQAFDASAFPVSFGSEVASDAFNIRQVVPKSYRKATKVMCRDIELAVVAAAQAVEDAGLVTKGTANGSDDTPLTYDPARMGCQIGAGLIVADIDELTAAFNIARTDDETRAFSYAKWGNSGMNDLTPLWLLKYLPNMLACHVTIIHDCRGPSNTITCSEASGALSVGESMRVIERGDADLCFAGGAESKMNMLALLRQWHMEMLAETDAGLTDEQAQAVVRPFGTDAIGSLPGEGAALAILEAQETAVARGTHIYAEILGFGAGQSCDLKRSGLEPHPDGQGLQGAIRQALANADVTADRIDAIVPMGMGVAVYDTAEAAALRAVFGPSRLERIPLITTKPNVGLCAAASSAMDIAAAACCLDRQMLPARLNGSAPMPGLEADSCGARDAQLDRILVCGCGFAGQNYAMILGRAGYQDSGKGIG